MDDWDAYESAVEPKPSLPLAPEPNTKRPPEEAADDTGDSRGNQQGRKNAKCGVKKPDKIQDGRTKEERVRLACTDAGCRQ